MRGYRKLAVLLACTGLFVAACGDDSGSSSATTAGGAATSASGGAATTAASGGAATTAASGSASGIDAAKAVVAQYRDPNQPIGVTIPLTGKPPKKTIAWLECELESCPYITVGMKDATAALGWDLKVIPSKSSDPAPAMQQAIDAGVDFIASSGEPLALYKAQADAAKAKGIKILSCYDTQVPDPATTNVYTQCGDTTFVQKTGPLMADWAIVDSNGAANVLIVSIPDFPVLVAETDAYKAEMKKNCPSCKITELNVTIDDLVGGKVPAAVASQLQSDSSINYVFNSFGSLPAGLTAALKTAGLDKQATVYGQDFSKFDLDEIVAGTMGAWSADPKAYAGWLMVDAAARLSLGMDLTEERASASLPTFLVEDASTAQPIIDNQGGDWAPPTMADDFKKLWGV
ncbi:MAG TPA: substrate-binding domain-containing protein [Acidimicrobiales bacterium]|nr:substrate-binding domain-containing protein [Acidimicrobiales bacterium]